MNWSNYNFLISSILLILIFGCKTQKDATQIDINKREIETPSLTNLLEDSSELDISTKEFNDILSFFPHDEPGGTFLVAQDGEHIASGAFGLANLELGVGMEMDNVFNIASVTKPFTAVAIFKLIEGGKVSLEDKVSKYVPDFPSEGKDITIGHLLSHTSGIKYESDLSQRIKFKKTIQMNRDNDSISVVEYFTKEKFDTIPGIRFDYSNIGYQLLGYIIEQISGQSYEEYLKEVFFDPLNMKNTMLESFTKVIKNRVTGYDSFNGNEYQIRSIDSDDSYFYSGGGLMSTVNDLSVWYNALMNYKIIGKNSLQKLIGPVKYNDGTYGGNGYGVFTGNLNGHDYILADGLNWGSGSIILYFPKSKLFIAHLRNCGYCKYPMTKSYSAPPRIAAKLLESEYLKDYIDKTVFQEYSGTYSSPLSQKDKVIIEKDGNLYLESKYGLLKLHPIDESNFFIERVQETITFDSKNLNQIKLLSNKGIPIEFKKE